MSQLLITKNALMHIESKIGDKAECQVEISEARTSLIVIFRDEMFIRNFSYSQLCSDSKTSGQLLSEFQREAVAFFASSE